MTILSIRLFRALSLTLATALALLAASPARADVAIDSRTARVDGMNLHYLTAGNGPETVVLIHGYAQSSRMWRALAIPELAKRFTVIAPDLPGFGDSDIPADGLDMKTAAVRIHNLVKALRVTRARVVGHDIGLMVAYAYASMYPSEVSKLALMDAFIPGVGDWLDYYHNPALWHFFFNGPTPEALVKGRERTYFEHFWNDFAADGKHSVSEADRVFYAAQYARPGRMRAGFAYFAAFQQAAKDLGEMAKTKLAMPVLVIGGAKAGGEFLVRQTKLVATTVTAVVLPNSGHWLLDEQPRETMDALARFL